MSSNLDSNPIDVASSLTKLLNQFREIASSNCFWSTTKYYAPRNDEFLFSVAEFAGKDHPNLGSSHLSNRSSFSLNQL